jgi:hypothetical protein
MATPLAAQRGGFTRARDHPRLRPMHGPALAQPGEPELGNALSVPPDDSIGYGQPAADAGEPLRVTSVEICPVVALQAEDGQGNVYELAGTIEMFLPFAQQVIALNEAIPTVAPHTPQQPAPFYEEPHSQAG